MSAAPEPSPELDAALAQLCSLAEQLDELDTRRARLYVERGDLLLSIRERDDAPPLSRLARVAGVSVPAIIQQIDKAKARSEGTS